MATPRRKHRTIVVGGKTYRYMIGRTNVSIRNEDNTRFAVVDFSSLLHTDWYNIERAQWKRYFHIKPKDIALYISAYQK